MSKQGGDDLEDDYVPDDMVAVSDAEELSEDDLKSDAPPTVDELAPDTAREQDDKKLEKKRKRRQKEKERRTKKRKLAEATTLDEPHSHTSQTSAQLAEYLASMQAKTYSKMTAMELDDIRIPESCLANTTPWTSSRSLDDLIGFIMTTLPTLHTRLTQKSKAAGAPTLLFITGAALRVVDVTRILRDKKLRGEKGGDVAKLFARHFKLEEHVAYLKRTKIGAAVGTPGRIGKLLCETDALSIGALSHIILDVSHRDAKKRSMLDIPETRDEVFKTVLGAEKIREGLRQGKIQLVLY